MSDLVYVYAVLTRPVEAAGTGINRRKVRWITADELAAAVSDVPSEDFDEEPLNANVRDMGWLGPRAIAHQDVNARLFEASDASLPLAFGTVFRDDERVQQMLAHDGQALTDRLDAVRGSAEWVVALHLLREPEVTTSPNVQALSREIEASNPGRAHLLRRRLATLEQDEAKRLQKEAAAEILASLTSVCRDVYAEPLPSDAVERPLLRASVLVTRQDETRFMDEIDRLRNRWPEPTYRLLLTGPWPPYRFGGLNNPRPGPLPEVEGEN